MEQFQRGNVAATGIDVHGNAVSGIGASNKKNFSERQMAHRA